MLSVEAIQRIDQYWAAELAISPDLLQSQALMAALLPESSASFCFVFERQAFTCIRVPASYDEELHQTITQQDAASFLTPAWWQHSDLRIQASTAARSPGSTAGSATSRSRLQAAGREIALWLPPAIPSGEARLPILASRRGQSAGAAATADPWSARLATTRSNAATCSSIGGSVQIVHLWRLRRRSPHDLAPTSGWSIISFISLLFSSIRRLPLASTFRSKRSGPWLTYPFPLRPISA